MSKKYAFFGLLFALCNSFVFSQIFSKEGIVYFTNEKYSVQIVLISDPDAMIKAWDNPDPKKPPFASPKSVFHSGDTVVPFIVFASYGDKPEKINLKGNYKLLKANKKYSNNHKENVVIVNGAVEPKLYFRSANYYGWKFNKSDSPGTYKACVEIFDDKGFKQDFELYFELLE